MVASFGSRSFLRCPLENGGGCVLSLRCFFYNILLFACHPVPASCLTQIRLLVQPVRRDIGAGGHFCGNPANSSLSVAFTMALNAIPVAIL